MVDTNSTMIDDAYKENDIHAKLEVKTKPSLSSGHAKQQTISDNTEPKKSSKTELFNRKRRILCELTEAEIVARSIPHDDRNRGLTEERVPSDIVLDRTMRHSCGKVAQEDQLSNPNKSLHKRDNSSSLFKAARQARQNQSISRHIPSQIVCVRRNLAADKSNNTNQKSLRNLR